MQRQILRTAGADLAVWVRPGTDASRWVVLVHGSGIDHRMFDAQIPEFRAEVNVVAFDLRGHGESVLHEDARADLEGALDDLLALHDHFGIAASDLVGHSFGGNIAQEFAHRHPERVRRLVTIGSPGQHRELSPAGLRWIALASHVYRRIPWGPFAAYSGRWSSRVPATRRYVRDALLVTGRRNYLDLGLSGFASVHPAPESTIPTLLVRGEHDMPAALDRIHDELARLGPVERAVIPGAGHQAPQDNPAEFTRVLLAFLA